MNEELYIPEDATFEDGVKIIEQWNEEHPEDCHSPYMGILDGHKHEYEIVEDDTKSSTDANTNTTNATEVITSDNTMNTTTETNTEIVKSPHTEDTSQLYVGGLMVVMVVSFMLLCALFVGKMKGDKRDER